jgi:hypothetical protein
VSGFDHSPFDEAQVSWHAHVFPYKMGNYKKKILTTPSCVGVINYGLDLSPESAVECHSQSLRLEHAGRVDCMVMWVHLDITDDVTLEYWDGQDFPLHLKTSVQFFPAPLQVAEESVSSTTILCQPAFTYGDSDIAFHYEIQTALTEEHS